MIFIHRYVTDHRILIKFPIYRAHNDDYLRVENSYTVYYVAGDDNWLRGRSKLEALRIALSHS